jgi:hypothetical protein
MEELRGNATKIDSKLLELEVTERELEANNEKI